MAAPDPGLMISIAHKERLEQAYLIAKRDKIESPVILVFDVANKYGRRGAEMFFSSSLIDEKLRVAKQNDTDIVLIRCLPRQEAESLVGKPPIMQGISEAFLAGKIPLVIITEGGTRIFGLSAPDEDIA